MVAAPGDLGDQIPAFLRAGLGAAQRLGVHDVGLYIIPVGVASVREPKCACGVPTWRIAPILSEMTKGL